MKNSHLENQSQNNKSGARRLLHPDNPQTRKIAPTLQRKVGSKIEIIMQPATYNSVVMIFNDHGIKKPGWLRKRFYINQSKRKVLNAVTRDAGLDGSLCGANAQDSDWSGQIHSLWHTINGVPPCN